LCIQKARDPFWKINCAGVIDALGWKKVEEAQNN